MVKKKVMFIAFVIIFTLSLSGCSLFSEVEGYYEIDTVNKHRPFTVLHVRGGLAWPNIYVNEQYQKLYIKEMSYEWDGNIGIFLRDKSYSLYVNGYVYDSLYGEYRYNMVGHLNHINPEKLFKGKKRGDEFKYTLKIVYSFDDEPESTQILEYNVKVIKGRFLAFIDRLIARIVYLIFSPFVTR